VYRLIDYNNATDSEPVKTVTRVSLCAFVTGCSDLLGVRRDGSQ
jgi:hypothetical protein